MLVVLILGVLLGGPQVWRWYQGRKQWARAETALQQHDLPTAAECLERYLHYQPDDAAGWFLAARTARRRERMAEAEQLLERCQQLGGVTEATRLEWNLLRIQQGDLGEIHLQLRRTIKPDHPDALLVLEALALGYLKREYLRDALEACELWLARQSGHPRPYQLRGWIRERLGDDEAALLDYRRVIEIVPRDREAHLALGRVLLRRQQPTAASKHFEQVLEQAEENEEALLGLAACRVDQGLAGEAGGLLQRVLANNPSSAQALFLQGKAALELGQPSEAEPLLRQAIHKAPDHGESVHLLIQSLLAQGKATEADKLVPELKRLRTALKRASQLLRDIAREPKRSDLRHEAGVLALSLGREDEALQWLEGALKARGDHRPIHATLAEYYHKKGDEGRARTHRSLANTP